MDALPYCELYDIFERIYRMRVDLAPVFLVSKKFYRCMHELYLAAINDANEYEGVSMKDMIKYIAHAYAHEHITDRSTKSANHKYLLLDVYLGERPTFGQPIIVGEEVWVIEDFEQPKSIVIAIIFRDIKITITKIGKSHNNTLITCFRVNGDLARATAEWISFARKYMPEIYSPIE